MQQLSSITPLEIILLALAAVGVFYFFRACWRNIKHSRQHLGVALLTLMMVLTAQTAQAQWSGSGTEADPYLITSTSDLDLLATNVNSGEQYFKVYFKQTKDIAYSTEGVGDTESNFTAIGNYSNSFRGHYDGQGHTISGIRIYKGGKNDADQCQGLFGKSYEDIQGITLADARITGYHNTGGIVGCSFGTVSDCHVAADVYIHAVQSNANSHGGIVGGSNRCSVSDCTSAATLTMPNGGTGSLYGGIAGANTLGTLRNNVAIGAVVPAADNSRYGAISGSNDYGTLQNNCYYACTVAGVENATGVGCGNADVTNNNGAVNASPDHFEQTGTNEYTIKTALGWNLFCGLLATEAKGYFTGKTVKLNGDITVSRMAGASYHDFTGTFNGQGYTLTFNYTTDAENAAPFQYVEDATIQNLHVAGTIQTSNKYAAGIIAQQYGKVTISDCQSSVIIKSSTSGDGTHGGFVAVNQKNASLTIQDCVFDGKLLTTTGTTKCGGFVGYSKNSVTVTNSLYTPAALENGETECTSGSATFVRNGEAGTNCHFSRTLGTAQGGGLPTFVSRGDGDGTSANPYKITNANDLKDLACYVNGTGTYSNGLPAGVAHNCSGVYFQQTNPITLTSDWTPIGTSSAPFKGNYDGGKNAISGLTVSGNYQYAGLFGYIYSDRVNGSLVSNELKNINIVDCNINVGSITNSEAGAIAGHAGQVKMSSCRVSGSITGYRNACGLIGNIETNASFTDCFVDVAVSGTGKQYNQNITPSVFLMSDVGYSASASGNYYHDRVGNVAVGSKESINNSATQLYTISAPSGLTMATTNATLAHGDTHYYATETAITLTVADADKVIIAFTAAGAASSSVAADKKSATVTMGSSDVTVSATLMALTGTSNGVTWSMSDTDSNGTFDRLTLSGSGTLSTSLWDADLAASITRVDISSTSINISGNPFSTLGSSAIIVVPSPAYGGSYTNAGFADKLRAQFGSYLFGVTTEGGTAAYKIATEDDLRNLAAVINANTDASTAISGSGKTFRQTADITLSQTFTPIGAQGTYGKNFKGTYDGGDKTISGLTVNTDKQHAGLFGEVRGATIKNVRLISPTVNTSFNGSGNGGTYAGALVGYAMESSKVENCFVFSPNVSATNSQRYVGAIVGSIYSSHNKLTNSLFYSDANYGIAGNYENGSLINSGRARIVTLGSGIASVSPDASDMANGIVYQNKTYYREGVTLTLPNNAPDGYFPVYSANGTEFSSDTYTMNSADGDVTLAATDRYAPITYTVHFDGNGSTSGEMADQTFVYDAAQNLTDNGYSRTITVTYNYNGATGGNNDATAIATSTFDGWATSADGAKVYDNQQSVSNLTTANGATLNLYAKWTGGSVTLPAPTKTSYTFAGWYSDAGLTNKVGDAGEGYTPSADITLYAKWVFPVSYIDADGNPQTYPDATRLTSGTNISDLRAGWYVVTEDVSYSSKFYCSGDIHLILCDGAKMTIDCSNNDAIHVEGNLTIYAQSTGSSMGQLEATGAYHDIYAGSNVTICGGKITATGTYHGIYACSNVTICGGQINATGKNEGIYAVNITLGWSNASDYIHASSYGAGGTVNIADGKTFWNGSEVLSGTISDMRALNGMTLTPISGVEFTKDDNGTSATFDGTSIETVSIPGDVTVNAVTLNRSFSAGKASTVMLPFDYTCNAKEDGGEFYDFAGVEKDKVTNQWVATMTKVNQLKANTPYMFVAANDIDGITFTLPEKVTLNTTGGGECQKADKGSHWTFKGTYSYMKWTSDTKDAEYTKERADEIGKVYGFAGVAKDDIKLGDFVKAASGARIRPLTCYLIWNNTPNSTRGMTRAVGDEELPSSIVVRLLSNIGPGDQGDDNGNQGNGDVNQGNGDDQGNDDNGGTTTIGTLDTETGEIDFGGWYTLSGRKLDTKPTQKGLYIHNGKKIVIK
jgi:uncharacterized repeat protein (TIGR02543 family)